MDSEGTLIMIAVICFLVGLAIISLVITNRNYEKHMIVKMKTEEEEREQQYQDRIKELNPDKVVGNRDKWIAFKAGNIVSGEDGTIPLKGAAYDVTNQGIILMLDAPYDIGIIDSFNEKENQEIINYLEKNGVERVITWFKITDKGDLIDDYDFRFGYEYAYKIHEEEKSFVISGSKNNKLKWKLVNIEFSPHYVTDYSVDTVSEGEGNVSGRAGSALVGGLIGGTSGAVIGSSMGRRTITQIASHSTNSANEREIQATALLTIENQNGQRVKLSEKYYEEDIIILKKYFLMEQKVGNSLVTEINQLKKLLDNKVITQEEFELSKKKLLS